MERAPAKREGETIENNHTAKRKMKTDRGTKALVTYRDEIKKYNVGFWYTLSYK